MTFEEVESIRKFKIKLVGNPQPKNQIFTKGETFLGNNLQKINNPISFNKMSTFAGKEILSKIQSVIFNLYSQETGIQ